MELFQADTVQKDSGEAIGRYSWENHDSTVFTQSKKASKLTDVIVATDDIRIYNHVLDFGGKAIMTSEKHTTGTERYSEVAKKLNSNSILLSISGVMNL